MPNAGSWFRRHLLYPVHSIATGRPVLRSAAALEDSQWWTSERLRDFQWLKLQALLTHAQTSVPYYRKAFAHAGVNACNLHSPEQLSSLPILTKTLIRANLPAMVEDGSSTSALKKDSTGGSTGENVQYYLDQRCRTERQAAVVRNNAWAGLTLGELEVMLWGSPFDLKAADRLAGRIKSVFHNQRLLSVYQLTPKMMDEYVELLARWRPAVITSYASAMDVFSRHLEQRHVTSIRPRGIIMSAEVLFPHMRERVESVFGCPVFNRYGCREFGAIAHECDRGGLHVNMERVYLEVIPEDDCPDGYQPGEILITDLDSYAMPMIRYRIGDIAGQAECGECPCGRGLALLGPVQGRTMDVITTLSGRMLPGTFWTLLSRSVPGVLQFQVVQKTVEHLVLNVRVSPEFTGESAATLAERIRSFAGEGTRVDVNVTDEIPVGPSGKFRFIISELHGKPPEVRQ